MTRVITFRIDDEVYSMLESMSSSEAKSVSDKARELLQMGIASLSTKSRLSMKDMLIIATDLLKRVEIEELENEILEQEGSPYQRLREKVDEARALLD